MVGSNKNAAKPQMLRKIRTPSTRLCRIMTFSITSRLIAVIILRKVDLYYQQ
jgi:hypothetical protein